MNKIYKCAKNCGSIEEVRTDDGRVPICCGLEMIEIKNDDNDESLGCFGCCGELDDSKDDE